MRIDSGLPLQNTADIDRTKKKDVPHDGQDNSGVTAELSKDTVQLNSLEEQANVTPEIRQEKVNSLQDALQSGEYRVSDTALADAILRDVLRK